MVVLRLSCYITARAGGQTRRPQYLLFNGAMAISIKIDPPRQLYLSDPQRTKLGRAILAGAIPLLNRLGLERFTFKKLSAEISSSEASLYRYFRNKNELLLYLASWYWDWIGYLIDRHIPRERGAWSELRIAIRVLTQPYADGIAPDYIDQFGMHRLFIYEGTRTYRSTPMTRNGDVGRYRAYHGLIERLSRLILRVDPRFDHPLTLASSIFQLAHDHSFFARHQPRVTEVASGEGTAAEVEAIIWSWVRKLLDRPENVNQSDRPAAPLTVFVTRSLRPDSPLRRWAARTGNLVCGKSLLEFTAVPFDPPERADWWFFYSARAVAYGLGPGLPPHDVRLAALGEGTARALRARAGRVDFVGNGSPGQVGRQFVQVAEGMRVFFPRAEHSRRSVQQQLSGRITVLDAVCYTNAIAADIKPIHADVIVFTSPRNVAAYLDRYAPPETSHLVAIGGVTAAALYQRGYTVPFPETPSETAIAELLDRRGFL